MATKAKAPKKTRGANAQGTAKRRIRKIFGDIRPTNAALVVAFPVPDVVVEIAAVAVIGCE